MRPGDGIGRLRSGRGDDSGDLRSDSGVVRGRLRRPSSGTDDAVERFVGWLSMTHVKRFHRWQARRGPVYPERYEAIPVASGRSLFRVIRTWNGTPVQRAWRRRRRPGTRPARRLDRGSGWRRGRCHDHPIGRTTWKPQSSQPNSRTYAASSSGSPCAAYGVAAPTGSTGRRAPAPLVRGSCATTPESSRRTPESSTRTPESSSRLRSRRATTVCGPSGR